jgi:tRNA(Ile)-lysidine synthase
MIDPDVIGALKKSKNLLAFSAGIDSTALFFILTESEIDFDCAIVDYGVRKDSEDEVEYAKELCNRYNRRLFTLKARKIEKNFEANARKIRYDFFEAIIREYRYDVLITAHQLNDWTEWFLMQFSKGAGLFELCGMRVSEKRGAYSLIRPLLKTSREELENYIRDRGIKAYVDASNLDRRFLRNRFRADFAEPLMKLRKEGIKRTFDALQNDRKRFESTSGVKSVKLLTVVDRRAIDALHQVDLALKKLGRLTSKAERDKLERGEDFIAARKIAVSFTIGAIWIAPYEKIALEKKFREKCRKLKIPPKIRSYIFTVGLDPDSIDIP